MKNSKIVVLDSYALNPGDLSWEWLSDIGDSIVYDRTDAAETASRIADAEVVLTNKTVIDESLITAAPHLKYIGVLATGYNVVDVEAARRRGIVVTNIPAYSTMSVAQTVFAHLLCVTQNVDHYARQNRNGFWSSCPDFSYCDTKVTELDGKTMGIVGLGSIGSAVARIALAFGMRVLAFTSKPVEDLPDGVRKASDLDMVFAESDVVSLHCPLNSHTKGLADRRRLSLMKPDSILINTARGPLIDEVALAELLKEGRIRAACLDVMVQEPPAADNPLLQLENCLTTPHIGWATSEARQRLMTIAENNLKAFLKGVPVNNVAG